MENFFILAEDDTSPIVSSCPTQPIVVVAEPGETFAVVSWTVPTAVDDSGDPVVVASVNSAPGARYNVNTLQTVIYMFADSNGNIEVCMFDIQVLPGKFFSFLKSKCVEVSLL